ncbi:hypothetical protein [Methanotorris formicicus]|uniref:hypothetical protein n=1 Tax=Methanotorris formicicus TaxID=213185 RepID=UPI000694E523|nr:hypothetical protein [Methanotorris formicicus]
METTVLLKADKIVVDCYEQTMHSGEINVPISNNEITKENIYGEIGEIIVGKKNGREKDNEITIFDSTGLAIQDVAVAHRLYLEAQKLGIRNRVELVRVV